MTKFKDKSELEQYLKGIEPTYDQYTEILSRNEVTSISELADASPATLVAFGVKKIHAERIIAQSKRTDSAQLFTTFEEFEAFLALEGSQEVLQYATVVWQAGYRSCAAIAHSADMLSAQHGPDISDLISFCNLRSAMVSRHKLLESKLPAPQSAISTSPSGLHQQEKPRSSHPKAVTAFDVTPAVQEYLRGLSATPARFKSVDFKRLKDIL